MEGLDCLVLTEIWLWSDDRSCQQIGDISLNGFTFHHQPRNQRRGGSVGILTKSLSKVRALPLKSHTSFESMVKSFLLEFASYLESIVLTPGHLLIMGNFNFHVDNPSASSASKFSSILNQFNLYQNVTQHTHTSSHTLNLVITRQNNSLIHN